MPTAGAGGPTSGPKKYLQEAQQAEMTAAAVALEASATKSTRLATAGVDAARAEFAKRVEAEAEADGSGSSKGDAAGALLLRDAVAAEEVLSILAIRAQEGPSLSQSRFDELQRDEVRRVAATRPSSSETVDVEAFEEMYRGVVKQTRAAQAKKAASDKAKRVRKLFNSYDADRSGNLDLVELSNLMKDLDFAQPAIDAYLASEHFKQIDTDSNGTLDYDEFVTVYNELVEQQGKPNA